MKPTILKLIHLTALCALSLLVSCAGVPNQPLANGNLLRGKKCVSVNGSPPPFSSMTPTKALLSGGSISGLLPSSRLANSNAIKDPAVLISQQLSAAMVSKLGMAALGQRQVLQDSPEKIAKACPDADYAVDVRTIGWGFCYFPVNWGTYRVFSSAQLRVIDCKSGQVVASGTHQVIPDKQPNSPSYDELTEQNAARLKSELEKNARQTTAHFAREILKL